MKKLVLTLLIVATLFIGISNVQALPFGVVNGTVNPGLYIDNNDGTLTFSEVKYKFAIQGILYGDMMNALDMTFEPDVFVNTSSSTIGNLNPGNWSAYLTSPIADATDPLDGYVWEIATAGTLLGTGDALSFSIFNVTLYESALTDASMWDEGYVWNQEFTAWGTKNTASGGSTAPVPEPGTILLLGAGLAGVGFYTRRKKS